MRVDEVRQAGSAIGTALARGGVLDRQAHDAEGRSAYAVLAGFDDADAVDAVAGGLGLRVVRVSHGSDPVVLVPSDAASPFAMPASAAFGSGVGADERRIMYVMLLVLVSTVYRPNAGLDNREVDAMPYEDLFAAVEAEFGRLRGDEASTDEIGALADAYVTKARTADDACPWADQKRSSTRTGILNCLLRALESARLVEPGWKEGGMVMPTPRLDVMVSELLAEARKLGWLRGIFEGDGGEGEVEGDA